MNARFLADMSVSCETCGSKLTLTMLPGAPVGKQNALAHVHVAQTKIRIWIIEHAKICTGHTAAPIITETESKWP